MREYLATKKVSGLGDDSAEIFDLKYFKTVFETQDDGANPIVYGVLVAKCIGEEVVEEADSGPISCCNAEICSLVEQLAENTVTPMALGEVLDEIIS